MKTIKVKAWATKDPTAPNKFWALYLYETKKEAEKYMYTGAIFPHDIVFPVVINYKLPTIKSKK